MMLLVMGGKTASAIRLRFAAQTCFVLNLTHDRKVVQFSSVHKVNFRKTSPQTISNNNELSALTPPRSVAIISVSVRSAEVRLRVICLSRSRIN